MKIVFIQPMSFFTWESINIGYLSSYIKKYFPETIIEFYSEFYDTLQTIVDACKDADIIGFTAVSPQYSRALEIAKLVKNNDNILVIGGYHPTNCHDLIDGHFDIIGIGEGESIMIQILKGKKNRFIYADRNLDINEIPFPDREIIKQKRNIDNVEKKFGKRIIALLANRGCPYSCVFCASKSMWKKVRFRTADNIFTEFDKITKDYKANFVTFADDELCVNKKQMIDFCEMKIKSGNQIEWGCNAVTKDLDIEMLKYMKAAGCRELWMGVESGDEMILKQMKKPNNIEQIKYAFKITKDMGFIRRSYCILGMPNETYNTIKMTEQLLDEIQPDIVGFTILAPYPGTSFYTREHETIDWSNVDEYTNDITYSKALANCQLKEEQTRLKEKYNNSLTFRNK